MSDAPTERQTVWRKSFTVALFGLALGGCDIPELQPPPTPQALADTLVYATEQLCVPYVVDGASLRSLTQKPSIDEQHWNVNGKDATHFVVNRSGSPVVTFNRSSEPQDHCSVWLTYVRPADQSATVALFVQNLRLDARNTSKPHKVPLPEVFDDGHDSNVVCIHGRANALISVTKPPSFNGVSLEVHIVSDPLINRAGGCI